MNTHNIPDPDTAAGRKLRALMDQAAKDVKFEIIRPIAKEANKQIADLRAWGWAQVSYIQTVALPPEYYPRFWERVRELCEENDIDFPFTEEQVAQITELMAA
jgi:hypothetical protein